MSLANPLITGTVLTSAQGQFKQSHQVIQQSVECMAFDVRGRRLAVGCGCGDVSVYSVPEDPGELYQSAYLQLAM